MLVSNITETSKAAVGFVRDRHIAPVCGLNDLFEARILSSMLRDEYATQRFACRKRFTDRMDAEDYLFFINRHQPTSGYPS